MKARIPFKVRNPTGAVAMNAEIRRQCVEVNAEYELELDALVLWALHEDPDLRLGHARLRRVYERILEKRKKMHDFYTSDAPTADEAGIEYYAATQKLKDYGFDVKAIYQELKKKYDTLPNHSI